MNKSPLNTEIWEWNLTHTYKTILCFKFNYHLNLCIHFQKKYKICLEDGNLERPCVHLEHSMVKLELDPPKGSRNIVMQYFPWAPRYKSEIWSIFLWHNSLLEGWATAQPGNPGKKYKMHCNAISPLNAKKSENDYGIIFHFNFKPQLDS